MSEVSIIGLNIAKHVFQAHGVNALGHAILRKKIVRRSRENAVVRRLMAIPGISPITATAITALAPPSGTFSKGRDFAAWVGLTPRRHSTGGKRGAPKGS